MKYHVKLESGRDFILNSGYEVWQAAYDAYEEACLMDDYLVDVIPIELDTFHMDKAFEKARKEV
jgi:hypothetical protein